MNTTAKVILWVLVLAAVGYAIYYFYTKNKAAVINGSLLTSGIPSVDTIGPVRRYTV